MTFKERVIHIIQAIPEGKVMSYGQVAAAAGSPRAARQVGGILRASNLDALPWWRVINGRGYISIKGSFEATPQLQKQLLVAEGVEVSTDLQVNMVRYRLQAVLPKKATNSSLLDK